MLVSLIRVLGDAPGADANLADDGLETRGFLPLWFALQVTP